MTNIVIIGADGQVGKQLLRHYRAIPDVAAQGTCYTSPDTGLLTCALGHPR